MCATFVPSRLYCHAGVFAVHRPYEWRGLFSCSSSPLEAHILLITWKLVLREGAFRSVPSQGPLGPLSKVHTMFTNRDLPFTHRATKGNSNSRQSLKCLFNNPDQQLKKWLLIPSAGVFVKWSLALRRSIASSDEDFSFKLFMHIYRDLYVLQFFW